MKRKVAKFTSIALILAMTISTLAGCSSSTPAEAPKADTPDASTSAAPDAADTADKSGGAAAVDAEGAFHDTAELVIDYEKAVDPKGADIVDGSFQATPEEKGALATQMVGTQNQFEGMNIGFSQHRIAGSEWYEQLVDFAQAEADYLGINLTIYDANDDMNQQIADVETLINLGMESIIVNPYNSTNVGLDSIIAADIPLTVVNQAVDFSGPFTFVSADVQDSGYKTGFELARYYDEKNGWKN